MGKMSKHVRRVVIKGAVILNLLRFQMAGVIPLYGGLGLSAG